MGFECWLFWKRICIHYPLFYIMARAFFFSRLFPFGGIQIGNPPTWSISIGGKSQKRGAGPPFHVFMIVTDTIIDKFHTRSDVLLPFCPCWRGTSLVDKLSWRQLSSKYWLEFSDHKPIWTGSSPVKTGNYDSFLVTI